MAGGVDTHKDFHVATVSDHLGHLLATGLFPATPAGYQDLLGWMRSHGHVTVVGVEGTGTWGAGPARFLTSEGVAVVVNRPRPFTRILPCLPNVISHTKIRAMEPRLSEQVLHGGRSPGGGLSEGAPAVNTPSSGPTAVELEIMAVTKVYEPNGPPVLSDITFGVPSGSFISVIGPSGCGKSTLLRIIAGLMAATSGAVHLNGLENTSPHPKMVYVFQQYTKSIFPWKTVIDNACFGLRHRSQLSKEERVDVARVMLDKVGLRDIDHYYPYQLSGGMQQRLALARALVCKPAILLMDEPCSNVDAITKFELQNLIRDVWREFELTIIYVTHDIDEALFLSQRILVMDRAPGTIHERIDVDLPHPRDQVTTRSHPRYLELREHIYGQLARTLD